MDDILILISILCLGKCLIMASLFPKLWQKLALGIVCVASVWIFYPFAIETNKINIENILMQQNRMMDLTLFFVVDLLLSIGFCRVVFARLNGHIIKKSAMMLMYLPSLMVFPVIFYLQINLSFLFIGSSFLLLTICYSAFVFLLIFGGGWFIGKLLPETETRMELIIIFSVLLFTLIICCTVFHPSAQIFSQSSPVNFKELLFSLSTIVVIFIIGFIASKIYKYLKK